MVWICGSRNPQTKLVKEERTTLKQKICYGVGHVFNDLCIQTWYSYLLIYFTKVAHISATGAGYIFVASQIADAISTPFIGYGCDKVLSKKISRKFGNRKIWHLMGSVGIAFIWPFVFSPCLLCKEDSPAWVPVAYYGFLGALFSVCWPMVEISHLSLMPHVAKHPKDAVELSAFRSAMKLGCGVYVYVITWILLGQNSEENVDSSVQKPFTFQTMIVVITGCLFALIFHWGVDDKETHSEEAKPNASQKAKPEAIAPECKDLEKQALEIQLQKQEEHDRKNDSQEKKTWKHWMKTPDFFKMVAIYMMTQNVLNLNQSYFPMYLTETLHFRKEAIAYFPLIILISGIVTSCVVKRLNRHFTNRVLFCAGCVGVVGSATWFYFTSRSMRNAIYAPTIIMGCGNSIMLVTSLAMVADMIGDDNKSSGFVYGVMALVDKTSLGLIVLGLQENYPESTGQDCPACAEYLKSSFSVFPGVEALLAFLIIVFLYKPSAQQRKRRLTIASGKDMNEDADFEVLPYLKSTEV